MKKITRIVYCLTLVLLLCGVTGCTKVKAWRASRAIAKADSDLNAGRYERAEINYREALRLGGVETSAAPDVFLKLGQIYHAQGRWHYAVGFLNEGLKQRTNDVPSKVMRSDSLYFMGFASLAFEGSAEVLRMQPGHPEAMGMLIDSAGGDVAKLANAISILEKQPESASKAAAYRTAQGTVLLQSRTTDAAEKEFQAALELDPKYYRAHFGMANVHNSRKDLEKAKAEILATIAGLPNRSGAISACLEALNSLEATAEAKRVAGEMIQKSPDFLPPYFFLASVALKEGLYDDCLAVLKKALTKDSANSGALAMCGDVFLARNDGTNALRYFQQAASSAGRTAPALLMKMGNAQIANRDLSSAKASFQGALDAVTNIVYPEAALALSQLAINQRDLRAARDLTKKLQKLIEERPNLLRGLGYTMLADLYLTQKEYDKAIAVMLEAKQQFTNVAELPYLLGGIYERVGPKAEARKAFEQALKMDTNNVTFLIALVRHDLSNGRYDDAYSRISSRAKERRDSAFLQYIQGEVFWEGREMTNGAAAGEYEKRIEGAIASFKESISLSQTNQEPYFALAQVYAKTGRQQEALRELEDYLGKTNNPSAHLLAAQIHGQLENYPKAAGEYEKIVEMNQRNSMTIMALNNLACVYNDHLGEVDKAYGYAQRARDMAPRNSSIADTLGWVTFKKGDYLRALGLFQEAAADRVLAAKAEFLYHFAMANYMVGDEEIARGTFQKALEALAAEEAKKNAKTSSSTSADQASAPVWVEDAKIKLSNLKLEVAAADPGLEQKLQDRLKATPSDPVLLRRLGMVQERRGDYKAALQSYETALKSNPKHSGIRLQIALLYAGPMKELARGLEMAKKVKSDFQNDPEAIRVVGKLAYQSGEYSLAKGLLEESVRNYPEDVSLRYEFGAALYSVGRVADAEQEMRKVVASGADVPQVAEAKQFLAFVTATKEPGKHPEAVQAAIAALAKATNNLSALMVVAVEAGTGNEYEKAVGYYTSILKEYPPFSPATRNLGLLYFSNAQDRAKAYDLLYKVRDQYSEDVVFGRALGIVACEKANYGLAALLLKTVVEGRPDDLEALFYLGKAQLNSPRKTEARQTLERAMQPGLPDELKKQARTMLEGLK